MNKQQTDRIEKMESDFDTVHDAVSELSDALDKYEGVKYKYEKLTDYYDGGNWRKDFEADERGELPQDMKRGVLSEDALYNLTAEHDELMGRMRRISGAAESSSGKSDMVSKLIKLLLV